MKFEKSPYFEKLKPYKLELPFGNYYLCPNFFIGELFEGVHFDWEKTEILVKEIIKFYGEFKPIAFISNRINSYSVDPQNWIKIVQKYNILVASAIVAYNNSNYINASLEKHFAKKSIKRCLSLSEAIGWVESLEEFN
ncbi:hypothetical protein [Algibacter sp. 2305UL17-15]|uniref:hypothetical protein n=1 Tax=Algibacter sp. 2305UL17-15 TaxID=3231268 RepID=UPI00345A48B6